MKQDIEILGRNSQIQKGLIKVINVIYFLGKQNSVGPGSYDNKTISADG
jgi:hypothetical protein